MIVLCGIPSEPPLAMARQACEEAGLDHLVLNQRAVADVAMQVAVQPDGSVEGSLRVGGRTVALSTATGVYLRVMDESRLPEVQHLPPDAWLRRHSRLVHDCLFQWSEVAGCRVANRLSAMASNNSKPYQAQLIAQCGFAVPDTLVTDDPAAVTEFRTVHPAGVVYKSISGVRSIVTRLDEDDVERLPAIRWCPVQFQELVVGLDVRVHVVGTEVFATAIETTGDDYRYAHRDEDGETNLFAYTLPDDIAQASVTLAATLGLDFAGIDLKLSPTGAVFCFEVNPSPAYSYYQAHTGQPIAAALVRYLAGD
jgi:glutathione synthase/RimK-type ligase-like ATP-grasp enzyme